MSTQGTNLVLLTLTKGTKWADWVTKWADGPKWAALIFEGTNSADTGVVFSKVVVSRGEKEFCKLFIVDV
jgi:hypothetical protein